MSPRLRDLNHIDADFGYGDGQGAGKSFEDGKGLAPGCLSGMFLFGQGEGSGCNHRQQAEDRGYGCGMAWEITDDFIPGPASVYAPY